MKAKIKTIDVNCLEWFDKINGNSYFAGRVTINYGLKTELTFKIPFQYGYGDHYEYIARDILIKNGYKLDKNTRLSRYCRENDIIYRGRKIENCLKRELKNY